MSVIGRTSPFLAGSAPFSFNIAGGNQINLRSAAVSAGWDQISPLTAVVTAPVYAGGGNYALTINGSFPNGLTLVNNSIIYGQGGGGGSGGYPVVGGWGNSGEDAASAGHGVSCSSYCNVYNNGVVAGASGGGGGGASANDLSSTVGLYGGDGGRGNDYYTGATSGLNGQTHGDGSYGGRGGDGGTGYSAAGQIGGASHGNYYRTSGGSGGAGGVAVSGWSFMTVFVTGSVNGFVS